MPTYNINIGIDAKEAAKGSRVYKRSADDVKASARGMTTANDKAAGSLTRTGKAGFAAKAGLVAMAAGVALTSAALVKGTRDALAFNGAMAEVNTLIDKSFDPTDSLRDVVKGLSAEYAQAPVTQAKALYQVISAGAKDASEATITLTASNKLAVGGVTSVAVAADGLTSIMNAYGKEAKDTTAISDAMFTAMKQGKTTIGELSGAVGLLAPIAAQTGISIDEMLGATAALTKGGLSTSQSMTGLRQAIVNVLKPTRAANNIIQEMGLEFTAADLKGKGLLKFMQDLAGKTQGNTTLMTQLFGSVEGMNAVLALTSRSGARDFANIMAEMENKAGATDTAVEEVRKSVSFLADQLGTKFTLAGMSAGDMLLSTLQPALMAINNNFNAIVDGLKLVGVLAVSVLIGKLVPSLAASVASFTAGATAAVVHQTALVAFTTTTAGAAAKTLALAAAIRVKSVAMALLGGPAGIIMLAVGALALWSSGALAAEKASDQLSGSLEQQIEAFRGMDEALQELIIKEKTKELAEVTQELDSLVERYHTLRNTAKQIAEGGGVYAGLGDHDRTRLVEVFQEKIETVHDSMVKLAQQSKNTGILLDGFAETAKTVTKEVEGIGVVVDEANGEIIALSKNEERPFKALLSRVLPLTAATNKYKQELALLTVASKAKNAVDFDLAEASAALKKQYDAEVASIKALNGETEENVEARKEAKKLIEDITASTSKVAKEQLRHKRAVAELTKAIKLLGLEKEEQIRLLKILETERDKNIKKIQQECEETDKLKECGNDAAKEISDSWKRASENMTDALGQFFRDGLDGFDSFKDSVVNTIKDMFAQMAGAATKDALKNIFSKFGGGSSTSTGVGDPNDINFVGPTQSKDSGKITSTTTGQLSGQGGGMGGMGGAGGVLAGLQTGSALGEASGGNKDVAQGGAGIGAIIGGYFGGAQGASIGAVIGGVVAGALFGGKKSISAQGFELGVTAGNVGGFETKTTKRKGGLFRGARKVTRKTQLPDDIQEGLSTTIGGVFDAIEQTAISIGAIFDDFSTPFRTFTRKLEFISTKGLSPDEIAERLGEYTTKIIGEGIIHFVEKVEGVSARFKKVVLSFGADSEFLGRAFDAAAIIEIASSVDVVAEANRINAEAVKTLTDRYAEQLVVVRDAAAAYEAVPAYLRGMEEGALALEDVARAISNVTNTQIELVASLELVKSASSTLFQDTAQQIRESLLSEHELYNVRQAQISDIVALIEQTTDPAKLAGLVTDVNNLIADAFNLLDPSQKAALSPEFIQTLENLEALVATQADAGIAGIEADRQAIELQVTENLMSAGVTFQDAVVDFADTMEVLQAFLARQTDDDPDNDFVLDLSNINVGI